MNLAEAHISAKRPVKSEELEAQRDVIQLLCAIFLAHQGNKEAKDETTFVCVGTYFMHPCYWEETIVDMIISSCQV